MNGIKLADRLQSFGITRVLRNSAAQKTSCLPAVGVLLAYLLTGRAAPAAGPELDVRNFGANCNAAVDSSNAIQAALNSVPATGGTVLIPCQLGVGAAGVRVSGKTGVIIKGTAAGAGLRSLSRTGQGALGFSPVLLVLQFCTNCEVRDLRFEGNNIGVAPLGLDRCTGTIVENNVIVNVGGNVQGGALVSSGGRNNQYLRNTIDKTGTINGVATRGMWIGNGSSQENEWNPIIKDNTIRNAAATGIATHAIGATIVGNTVDTTLGAGIKVSPPPVSGGGTNLVEGNRVSRNLFHGIQINNAFDVIVRGNVAEQNSEAGIWGHGGFDNSQITGNTVRDNNFDQKGGWLGGIYLHHANNVLIENNDLQDTRTGSSRSQDTGIILNAVSSGGINNVTIRGNVCRNHSANGIYLQTNAAGTMSGVVLQGNTCSGNARYGLQLEERSSGAIRNVTSSGDKWVSNSMGEIGDNTVYRVRLIESLVQPSISMTSPFNGSTVTGVVSLTANAANAAGVTFRVNGVAVGAEDTSAPYAVSWTSSTVANGSHAITAIARSASGEIATDAVTINVDNGSVVMSPPTVSITSPAAGALVSGIISLAATASSSNGVKNVQFLLNGFPVGEADTVSPYSTSLNTASINPGTHTLEAVVRDTLGGSARASIQITTSSGGPAIGEFVTNYFPGTLVTGGYAGWVGARIQVGASPLTVTELGRYTLLGNKGTHTLKIVDGVSGADIPSGSVQISLSGKPAGQFTFGRLAAPVTLAAGKAYYVVSSENVLSGGDHFQEYNGVIHTTTHAKITNAAFWDRTLWRHLGGQNQSVGPINFRYKVQ